jgi:hypothetical protein
MKYDASAIGDKKLEPLEDELKGVVGGLVAPRNSTQQQPQQHHAVPHAAPQLHPALHHAAGGHATPHATEAAHPANHSAHVTSHLNHGPPSHANHGHPNHAAGAHPHYEPHLHKVHGALSHGNGVYFGIRGTAKTLRTLENGTKSLEKIDHAADKSLRVAGGVVSHIPGLGRVGDTISHAGGKNGPIDRATTSFEHSRVGKFLEATGRNPLLKTATKILGVAADVSWIVQGATHIRGDFGAMRHAFSHGGTIAKVGATAHVVSDLAKMEAGSLDLLGKGLTATGIGAPVGVVLEGTSKVLGLVGVAAGFIGNHPAGAVHVAHEVGHAASSAAHEVGHVASGAAHVVGHVAGDTAHVVGHVASGTAHVVGHVASGAAHVVEGAAKAVGHTVGGIAHALVSW